MNLVAGLEEIGTNAFRECTSLHEIVIPPTVKAMKGSAFEDCSTLSSVNLGEGLEEFGAGAYLG